MFNRVPLAWANLHVTVCPLISFFDGVARDKTRPDSKSVELSQSVIIFVRLFIFFVELYQIGSINRWV